MKRIFTLFVAVLASVGLCGADTPPLTYSIDSEEAFAQWKTFNSNNDDYTFKYDATKSGAVCPQNTSMAANDWLVSPVVTLTAGMAYTVTFSVQNLSTYASDKQDFSVYAGTAPEVAALTDKVFSVTSLAKSSWAVDKSGTFVATASGEYYFGLNLVSKSYMGDFAVYSIKIEPLPSYPGAVTDLSAVAAPGGALSATLTWKWPAVDSNGATDVTITGAKIYRGNNASFAISDTYLVKSVDIAATPGMEYSISDEVTKGGKYYYKVVPFNAEGSSPVNPMSAEVFIGPAQSISAVSDLKAAVITGDNQGVALTWNPPTATDGGYFNPAEVGYTIKRSKDGGPAEELVTNWKGSQPYVDNALAGLGSYVYTVYTVYNGSTSWSGVNSNAIITGGTMNLPYSNNFDASNSADLFTFFHGAECTRDWSRSSTKKALSFWGGGTADAWAVLPIFHLEAGKTYRFSFTAYISNSSSPKNLGISYGSTPDAAGLATSIFEEKITNTLGGDRYVSFSVQETGDYYIGLHCFGETNSNDIYVDNILLQETATAPMPVTDVAVNAGAEGALTATISWLNPTLSTAGQPLSSITKVDVRCGSDLIASITDPAIGGQGSCEANVSAPGNYTYTITAYLEDNASESVEVTSPWIGYDTPKAPENVTVTVVDHDRSVDFTAVTEGIHGGYINIDQLKYVVSRNDEILSSDVTKSPYMDEEPNLPLAMYTYSVVAVNGVYTGQAASATPIMLGEAMSLPYEPSFETKDVFELWTLNNWSYSSSSHKITVSQGNSWAYTPPLDMKHGICQVSFRATCMSYIYPEKITLYLTRTNDGDFSAGNAYKLGEYDVTAANYPDKIDVKYNIYAPGKHYIAFGAPEVDMTLGLTEVTVTQVSSEVDPTLGIDAVNVTNDNQVHYYNLQGMEIQHPTSGQIVIVRRGSKVTREVYTDR